MAQHHTKLCSKCKQDTVEVIDDFESTQCPRCNDRDIERNNARREWDYYHNEQ